VKTNRRSFLTGAILLLLPLVIVVYARSDGNEGKTRYRWDIISRLRRLLHAMSSQVGWLRRGPTTTRESR
jgi:hypothetical protein